MITMEALIVIIILLVILVYMSFNFKASFVFNNKQITFSVNDKKSTEKNENNTSENSE